MSGFPMSSILQQSHPSYLYEIIVEQEPLHTQKRPHMTKLDKLFKGAPA